VKWRFIANHPFIRSLKLENPPPDGCKLPRMRAFNKLVVFVALCLPTGSAAQQKPENAAVKYLRADVSLRQTYPLAPDAAVKLERALESPLDGEDEKLVAAADEALVEFNPRNCSHTMRLGNEF
jgi:hypothetical protein